MSRDVRDIRLTPAQQKLFFAIYVSGDVLKVHRGMDGMKEHMLHPLDGSPAVVVPARDVEALVRNGLIASNMKFPAATFVPAPRT